MKDYWCIGNDCCGRSFSVMISAENDMAMWNKLDNRFGAPVSRNGLKIAEVSIDGLHFGAARPVFGL